MTTLSRQHAHLLFANSFRERAFNHPRTVCLSFEVQYSPHPAVVFPFKIELCVLVNAFETTGNVSSIKRVFQNIITILANIERVKHPWHIEIFQKICL